MPYEAFDFSEKNLINAFIIDRRHNSEEELQKNERILFLLRYLTDSSLDCKTILVEERYVDLEYLEDYTNYYARCFPDYGKYCRRLHFFSSRFDRPFFNELIEAGQEEGTLGYLGYVVAKPIPQKVVGRTVLKTWSENKSNCQSPQS